MNRPPRCSMVLAAGLGRRIRAVDSERPKPLVAVAGAPLISYALRLLGEALVCHVVINTYYRAPQLEAFLSEHGSTFDNPKIHISRERTLLGTGGGVRNALPLLGDAPFFVMNSDTVILDGGTPALRRLSNVWEDRKMDALLLVCPLKNARGYDGFGDFLTCEEGRLMRYKDGQGTPLVFTGAQILHPRLFKGAPVGPYSLNQHYDEALSAGRLFGLSHDGIVLHIGSPEGFAAGEAYLASKR